MDSSPKPASPSGAEWTDRMAPEILISLATGPLLLGLVGGKALLGAIRELGVLSEEVFRGDRLPLLNFPANPEPNPDNPESV